jgi:subtilisin
MQTLLVAKRLVWERSTARKAPLAEAIAPLVDEGVLQFAASPCFADGAPKSVIRVAATSAGARKLRAALGQTAWIEKEIRHTPQARQAFVGGETVRIQVSDGARRPLPHAEVTLLGATPEDPDRAFFGRTDSQGQVELEIDARDTVQQTIVMPITGHWSTAAIGIPARVDCRPMAFTADGTQWWHRCLGLTRVDPQQGSGVRIGVIDTGCGEHEALEHVRRIGSFGGGNFDEEPLSTAWHGTHVCGIVAARPGGPRGYWGIAPGAEMFAAGILGEYEPQDDIVNALKMLVEKFRVDLVNISLGADEKSNILNEQIKRAENAGCLCICAAGNTGGPVLWPARFARAIAVSAIGSLHDIPQGTFAAGRLPPAIDAGPDAKEFALALFSGRGQEVSCCGPGVGVVSTYPRAWDRPIDGWCDFSGTSMAAPAVCGALAVALSQSAKFAKMKRTSARTKFIRALLCKLCRSVGLPAPQEGWGLPVVA